MDIKKIHQKILEAAIGICENRLRSLENLASMPSVKDDRPKTLKILKKQHIAVREAIKTIKEIIYDAA